MPTSAKKSPLAPRSTAPRAPAAAPRAPVAAISPAVEAPVAPAADLPAESPEDALFYESRVADSFGVARQRVRELRGAYLTEGTDYAARDGFVVLTHHGLDRLASLLAMPEKIAAATPSGPPARRELTVVAIPRNPRILLCCAPAAWPLPASAPRLYVRVRSNENFLPGMTVPCIEAQHGTWQHFGRLPRRRGKW